MCIVVINNAQISIQFSRKASEAPPWLMERIPNLPIRAPCRFASWRAKRHGRAQKSPASVLTGHL